MLKPKPWWLRLLTKEYTWVTIAPHIYYPTGWGYPISAPALVAHETMHLNRQLAMGVFTWFYNYFVHRSFRLNEEALGMAEEVRPSPEPRRTMLLTMYGHDLATVRYLWAAESPEAGEAAIRRML